MMYCPQAANTKSKDTELKVVGEAITNSFTKTDIRITLDGSSATLKSQKAWNDAS